MIFPDVRSVLYGRMPVTGLMRPNRRECTFNDIGRA